MVPFGLNVAVPAPGVENGVAPASVKVPDCAPVAKVKVAVAVVSAFKMALPPTLTEPDARANVALLITAALGRLLRTLMFPETAKLDTVDVSVQVIVEAIVGVVVPPTAKEAQLTVPEPAIVADVATVALFCRVIPVDTVNKTLAFTVIVAGVELELLNATELIVAFAVTVIASPARMITSSVLCGTVPPGQGALAVVEFQLPLPAVVTVAALPPMVAANNMTRKTYFMTY